MQRPFCFGSAARAGAVGWGRDRMAKGKAAASDRAGAADVLTLGAGKNGPQKRIGRPSDWTAEKAAKFIEALADSCNVSLAARAVRRSVSSVYLKRTEDAEFRAQWDQALAIGYARLEMMMLERALHGTEKVVKVSGESRIMREYNDRVALALLRHHRDAVGAFESGVGDEDYEEACERIVEKLARLRERELDEAQAKVETKTGGDRLRLIALALKLQRRER